MLDQLARMLVRARRLDEADSMVAAWRTSSNRAFRRTALDLRVMIDRERGQLRTSLRNTDRAIAADSGLEFLELVRGNTLARLGDYAAAERLYERRIHPSDPKPHPWLPKPAGLRGFCWEHALLADAIAPAGDTVRLLAIADTLERVCPRSYFARDWTLHHHVRGLVHAAARRYAEAVREFRRAPHIVADWWPRTTVELAKAQLALGRAREAITTLQTAYATPLDAMGRYVPRSELDYYMALAFKAAGLPDSAAVYAAHVRRAWKDADPEVKRLLASLGGATK
jgi:tetratricopeptide (TPR) repeat protein